jgi:hypothetical protein
LWIWWWYAIYESSSKWQNIAWILTYPN